MTLQAEVSPPSAFALSRDVLESLVAFLESADAAALGHGEH